MLQPRGERRLVHEVVRDVLAVEADDGDPLEVGGVQRVVGFDVHLVDLEVGVRPEFLERRAGVVAQVAAGAGVERDGLHRTRKRGERLDRRCAATWRAGGRLEAVLAGGEVLERLAGEAVGVLGGEQVAGAVGRRQGLLDGVGGVDELELEAGGGLDRRAARERVAALEGAERELDADDLVTGACQLERAERDRRRRPRALLLGRGGHERLADPGRRLRRPLSRQPRRPLHVDIGLRVVGGRVRRRR